jgi:hypothetical protein
MKTGTKVSDRLVPETETGGYLVTTEPKPATTDVEDPLVVPSKLRLDQDFTDTVGVKKLLRTESKQA